MVSTPDEIGQLGDFAMSDEDVVRHDEFEFSFPLWCMSSIDQVDPFIFKMEFENDIIGTPLFTDEDLALGQLERCEPEIASLFVQKELPEPDDGLEFLDFYENTVVTHIVIDPKDTLGTLIPLDDIRQRFNVMR